jgi:hypothetical protein
LIKKYGSDIVLPDLLARSLSAAVRLQPPLKRKSLDAMSILDPKCHDIS